MPGQRHQTPLGLMAKEHQHDRLHEPAQKPGPGFESKLALLGEWIDAATRIKQVAVMHSLRENQSLVMHRRIAALLIEQPGAVIGKALDNLHRWTAAADAAEIPAVYREWKELLLARNPDEIVAILVSEDEDAVRLRQSSPFAGVLDAREVWKIKRRHEAA